MKGMYVAVLPTKESIKTLDDFLHDCPVMRNSLHPHVTVMYCKQDNINDDKMLLTDSSKKFTASPLSFRTWSDHKRRPIIVLQLHSNDLHERHKFWQHNGLKHTFPYSPHQTITDSNSGASFADLEAYCSILNDRVQRNKIMLTYSSEYATELEDSGKLLTNPMKELDDHIAKQTKAVAAFKKMSKPRLKSEMKPLKRVGPKLLPKVGPKALTLKKSKKKK